MTEQLSYKSRHFQIIRRSLSILGGVLGVVVLTGLVGIVVLWGQFWDFRVGHVPSDTCGNCHSMEFYIESLRSVEQLGGYHAVRGATCTDCHPHTWQSQVRESVAQLLGNYDEPLTRLKYPQADCLQCHEHSSYQQIAWRTTDLGVSDAQAGGNEANPHQPPHYQELECYSCHNFHRPSTLLCSDCHNYEFAIP